MTKKEIEQVAKEFAIKRHGNDEAWLPDRYESATAFIAGANFRQPEIDALALEIKELKATLDIAVNKPQNI